MNRVLARLARVKVTVGYAMALVAVAALLVALGPYVQDRVIRHASTNLHNLGHGRIGTLLDSAFVTLPGPMWIWLPGLVCLLALCEIQLGSLRLLTAFIVGHIGATVLVAIGLYVGIRTGALDIALARAADVGMSYGAMGVLGVLTATLPRRWWPPWCGWWLGVAVGGILVDRDFTNVGHAVALALGMILATRWAPVRKPSVWPVLRWVLLAAGSGFGFLILAEGAREMVVGAGIGLLCATGAVLISVAAQRNSSAQASIQSDRQDSGTGSSSSSPGISHS